MENILSYIINSLNFKNETILLHQGCMGVVWSDLNDSGLATFKQTHLSSHFHSNVSKSGLVEMHIRDIPFFELSPTLNHWEAHR